ncbi:MAG: hypothetical protein ACK54J_27415, partial [Pseudanabaena sp.]
IKEKSMSLNIKLLEQICETVKAHNAEFSTNFYNTLFAEYSDVKPLFANANMKEQGDHLYKSLVFVVCRGLDGYEGLLIEAKLELQRKVAFHLQKLQRTSVTFALNFLQGTPSFILCGGTHPEGNRNLEILDRWFGHESEAKVFTRIDKYLQSDVAIAKLKN